MAAVANLYHGATLILLSLTLITFLMRIYADNSIYLALPTAFLVLAMLIFVIRPYFSEIALYYADAELRQSIRVPATFVNKVEEWNFLYKISNSWLSLK